MQSTTKKDSVAIEKRKKRSFYSNESGSSEGFRDQDSIKYFADLSFKILIGFNCAKHAKLYP